MPRKKIETVEEIQNDVIHNVGNIVEDIKEEETLRKVGATEGKRHVFYKCKYCNHCFDSRGAMHKHANNCRLNPEVFE